VYTKGDGQMDGASFFVNQAGLMLHRREVRDGCYWWLSDRSGPESRGWGSYYRARSWSLAPPATGWVTQGCHAGQTHGAEVLQPPEVTLTWLREICAEARLTSQDDSFDARGAVHIRGHKRSRSDSGACPTVEPPSHDLKVLLLSGIELAEIKVTPSWTGARIKTVLCEHVTDGKVVTKLVVDGRLLADEVALHDVAPSGATVATAILQACDFIVEGAGMPQVNGRYVRTEQEFNGAPSFRNEVGTLLFYYRFRSGSLFWYFSDDSGGKDLNKSHGDYYRVKTLDLSPPLEGWSVDKCPLGRVPCPKLRRPDIEGLSIAKGHIDDAVDEEDDDSGQTSLSGGSCVSGNLL